MVNNISLCNFFIGVKKINGHSEVNFSLNISFLSSSAVQQNQQSLPKLRPQISQDYYRPVFNTEFNLCFGLPTTNTCGKFDELALAIKVSSGEERQELIQEQKEHQDEAQAGSDSKRYLKEAATQSWSGKKGSGTTE